MKWISIEDQLPPQKVYVLVASRYIDKKNNSYFYSQCIAERIGERWFEGCQGLEVGDKKTFVTHWMPLPDDPDKINKVAVFRTSQSDNDEPATLHNNPVCSTPRERN